MSSERMRSSAGAKRPWRENPKDGTGMKEGRQVLGGKKP
jgi:hypothetical protein